MKEGTVVGSAIVFKGYGDEVPEAERYLTADAVYTVVEIDEKDDKVVVEVENGEFDSKKKVSEKNPKTISIEVFSEEFDLAPDEAPADEAPAEEVVEEAPAAAPATARRVAAAKAPVAAVAKAATPAAAPKAVARAAPAPAAAAPAVKVGANKVTPVAAVAKSAAGKAKAIATEAVAAGDEEVEALAAEDADILELVESTPDLLGLAKELAEQSAAHDYRLGGILYHVRLTKAHHTLDERYKERGGFGLYVKEHLSIEYRKAMYLVNIYFSFNKFDIDAAKVAEIGWTKAAKICEVMTEENAAELVALASDSSVSDLVDNIKENYVTTGGTSGERKRRVIFKFALYEDSAAVVQAALEAGALLLGKKKLDEVFEHIITEWATEHPMQKAAAVTTGRRVVAPSSVSAKPAAAAAPAAVAKPVAAAPKAAAAPAPAARPAARVAPRPVAK